MTLHTARRALTDATLALMVATGSAAAFVPPLLAETLRTPLRTGVTALLLALALVMHWVWLGQAARRMGRSVRGWLALALLFPLGGAAALLLLMGFLDEPSPQPIALRG
jgi:hypothetical protein